MIQKTRPEKKLSRGVVPKKEVLSDKVAELIAQAFDLEAQERYTAMLQVSEQIIVLDPNNSEGWALKGLSLCRFGKYEETLEPYERAIQLDPTNFEAMRNLADSLNKLGRHAEALPLLEREHCSFFLNTLLHGMIKVLSFGVLADMRKHCKPMIRLSDLI